MTIGRMNSFRENVRRSSLMLFGQSVADRPTQTRELIEERLRAIEVDPKKPLWLTPVTFWDFDRESFTFLAPEELAELTDAVAEVRAVAATIPEDGRASAEQLDRTRPHFVRVVEVMGFDRYDDPDALIYGKVIEQRLVPWPSYLDQLRFRTGYDSTDDPALWVWVYVAETNGYDDDRFLARADVIETALKPLARGVAPEGRVYLYFRTTSDLPEVEGVAT